jgi:hypothetical protein
MHRPLGPVDQRGEVPPVAVEEAMEVAAERKQRFGCVIVAIEQGRVAREAVEGFDGHFIERPSAANPLAVAEQLETGIGNRNADHSSSPRATPDPQFPIAIVG